MYIYIYIYVYIPLGGRGPSCRVSCRWTITPCAVVLLGNPHVFGYVGPQGACAWDAFGSMYTFGCLVLPVCIRSNASLGDAVVVIAQFVWLSCTSWKHAPAVLA